jgi:hypothetical protein
VHKAATAEVAPGDATGGRQGFDSPPSQGSAQHRAPVTEHGAPSTTTCTACLQGEGGYGDLPGTLV